jgi:hypothetical protein
LGGWVIGRGEAGSDLLEEGVGLAHFEELGGAVVHDEGSGEEGGERDGSAGGEDRQDTLGVDADWETRGVGDARSLLLAHPDVLVGFPLGEAGWALRCWRLWEINTGLPTRERGRG